MLKVLHIEDGVDFGGLELNSMLTGFKQYASIPDDSRDALLRDLLRSSVRRVQEYADKALVPTRLLQTIRLDEERHTARLYMGGGEIVQVTDINGSIVSYEVLARDLVKVDAVGSVSIEYITEPKPEDVELCKPVVYRYATGLYDGEGTEVLNGILNEVLC